jgi:hypothetical protein
MTRRSCEEAIFQEQAPDPSPQIPDSLGSSRDAVTESEWNNAMYMTCTGICDRVQAVRSL